MNRELEKIVKFISYDGEYPHLCCGTLVISVNGIEYQLKNILLSGGYCCYSNRNVEYGCCGGCH